MGAQSRLRFVPEIPRRQRRSLPVYPKQFYKPPPQSRPERKSRTKKTRSKVVKSVPSALEREFSICSPAFEKRRRCFSPTTKSREYRARSRQFAKLCSSLTNRQTRSREREEERKKERGREKC